jgi:hypothetical protein
MPSGNREFKGRGGNKEAPTSGGIGASDPSPARVLPLGWQECKGYKIDFQTNVFDGGIKENYVTFLKVTKP